jgi:hypothetical protein
MKTLRQLFAVSLLFSFLAYHANAQVSWNTTSSLVNSRSGAQSVINNGYIYAIGGDGLETIEYSQINPDGTLGTWSLEGISLGGDYNFFSGYGVGVSGDNLYIIGGLGGWDDYFGTEYIDETFTENEITYAQIQNNGSVSSNFTSTAGLVEPRYNMGLSISSSYMYALGGGYQWLNVEGQSNGGGTYNSVEFSPIQSNGLAGWLLTSPMVAHNGEVYSWIAKGFLYALGNDTIEMAQIQTDGSLNSWTVLGSSPVGTGQVAVVGDWLYCVSSTGVVQVAHINGDGTLGQGTTIVNSFVYPRTGYGISADTGYLYAVGGGNIVEYLALPFTSQDTPPSPPTGLNAIAGNNQVNLTWNSSTESDVIGYNVYRNLFSYNSPIFTKINFAPIQGTNYLDTTVENGLTYTYQISAVDTSGTEGGYSNQVQVTPEGPPLNVQNSTYIFTPSQQIDHSFSNVTIPASSTQLSNTQIVYDGNTIFYVTWDEDSPQSNAFLNHSGSWGQAWQTSDAFINTTNFAVDNIRAAADTSFLYVINHECWYQNTPPPLLALEQGPYLTCSSTLGDSWTQTNPVDETKDIWMVPPPTLAEMCTDQNGHVAVIWSVNIDSVYATYYINVSSDYGVTPFPPATQGEENNGGAHDIAMDKSGFIGIIYALGNNVTFTLSTDFGQTYFPDSYPNTLYTIGTFGNISAQAPIPAVGISNNTAYVAWPALMPDSTWSILFRRSTYMAQSFYSIVTLAQGINIMPEIALSVNNNDVGIAWKDTTAQNAYIYFTGSIDGGITFSSISRVDDTSLSDIDFRRKGMTFLNDTVYCVWIDGRAKYPHVYFNKGFLITPLAPEFNYLPALKLFSNQSINNAFYLEDYNTSDIATVYSMLNNFAGLATLNGSTENQGAYGSPTVGTNTFIASNAIGASTAISQVKYSTYKIYKLPKVGLTVGSSWDVNVANYTYSSIGLSIPPSFGNPDAISVSDTTLVSATWLGNTAIHITSLQPFSGAVNVNVIASPDSSSQSFNSTLKTQNLKLISNAASPYGSDVDVENIQVYTNLLTHSTFSISNDTSIWMPLELAPGRTTLATQSWISTYTDSAGTKATGVWQFTFANSNSGVKSTPNVSTWIPMSVGQWYTVRMRVVADTPSNAHQSVLFGYDNYIDVGLQTDISVNMLFGIPTTWTWQETPMLAHTSTTTGYPQFIFKASSAGHIYIDEIQIINSAPTLVDANRNNTRMFYTYGEFDDPNDTTGWGGQVYNGAGSTPEISVSNNSLQLNFNNASSGTGQQGIKWTANNGVQGIGAATFPVTVNREVGVRATVTIQSGSFNSLGVILLAAYGVQTNGQQTIAISPSNLLASAEVGVLSSGTYRTVANAINPYYQFQFGVRSDQSGILSVTNVDLDTDQDDPNFGDATLFP